MSMKKEIVLIIIGVVLGVFSSSLTLVINNRIERSGRLKLYTKIVYSKANLTDTWGFYEKPEGTSFHVPLWLEIQNTSNATQVVRNLNIVLSRNNKDIATMSQINKIGDEFLGNDGAYSFVLEPRSIHKYDCHFTMKKSMLGTICIVNYPKSAEESSS